MKTSIILILTILSFMLGSSCQLTPPNIHFTGNKTVIERQIVGNYQELEKDAWVIASVQTSTQTITGAQAISGGDPSLFRALKVREIHYERIRTYKNEGAIGETSNGLVQYIPVTKYQNDTVAKEILLRTLDNENEARRTIFVRTLYRINKKQPEQTNIQAFGRIFAKEQFKLAQKNDWIEENPGKWIRKK